MGTVDNLGSSSQGVVVGTQEVGKTGVDGRHVVPIAILHLYLFHNSMNCEIEQIVQVVVIQIGHTYHFVLTI